jgi:hypothetical protein
VVARVFELFAGMIDSIPARAVFKAIELERRMILDDLEHERDLPFDDTVSVLNFCHFLEAARLGEQIYSCVLPTKYVMFLRKTVQRLINAGELDRGALKNFDDTFSENPPGMQAA